MTCSLPINTSWSMRPERTKIGISKWYCTERMEQPWSITSKDHLVILLGSSSMTLWYVWNCMSWKMRLLAYFSCAPKHRALWPRSIAKTDSSWCTLSPSLKTTIWCQTLVEPSGEGASEVQVTAYSLLGLAQVDLRGIVWTKTSAMSLLTTFVWKHCCIGNFGKSFHCVFNMYMRCMQWLCWSYLVDAIIGTMKGWNLWSMVQVPLFMNLMDACMGWNHNSKMQAQPSRNHGGSYRGGFHSLICMKSVMAHIHMVHVQVEKLVQHSYTRTRLWGVSFEEWRIKCYGILHMGRSNQRKQTTKRMPTNQRTKHAHA